MKKLIKKLSKSNEYEYNLLKSSEELQELSLALTQFVNKPNKVDKQEIIDEIGDVTIRLKILKELFDKKAINKRIKYKISKFKSYIKEDKYKGKI